MGLGSADVDACICHLSRSRGHTKLHGPRLGLQFPEHNTLRNGQQMARVFQVTVTLSSTTYH